MKPIIRPKNRRAKEVDWKISEHARDVVKHFAEYSEYSEEEIVERCIMVLLDDTEFQEWIASRRFHVRIVEKVFPGGLREKIQARLEAKEQGA